MSEEILKLFEISKGDCLRGINLSVCSGEILGIVGSTAAGKSCLANIISGISEQDGGDIFFFGEKASSGELKKITARADKTDRIICELTVAENVFLGNVASFGRVLTVDNEKLYCECRAALHRVGLSYIRPDEKATSLNAGECRLLELARLLQKQPKIIVLDDFFSPVCKTYRERLVRVLGKYKDCGGAVVFVTRDVDLSQNVCDRIVFMENGTIKREAKSQYVVITDATRIRRENTSPSFDILLRATNLCDEKLNNISFKLFGGEILGILGQSASDIHRLGQVLFGDLPLERGRITVGGHSIKSIKGAMRRKMAYARADFGFEQIIEILDSDREIFILDEVLSGFGKYERQEILSRMDNICRRGGAVIYISEDADEQKSLCDRILILSRGEIAGECTSEYDKQEIIDLMIK